MPKSIISEGKTTNEAIENGLKILKVTKNMVNVKILESEKKSFFSILTPRVVKVELTLKEGQEKKKTEKEINPKENKPISVENLNKAEKEVKDFLDKFLMQISKENIYTIKKDDFGLDVNIQGDSVAFLIGYRGDTLYAFQTIISAVANNNNFNNEKIKVILDINNYKSKREKTLQSLAVRMAKTVEKTGKNVTLEPMKAYERKIIHSMLQSNPKIKTESIGEEPKRRIVISLNK